MGKIKIHEVAKELGLTSKEIMEIANQLNIEAKSHMSSITEEEMAKIEKKAKKPNTSKKEDKKEEKSEPKAPFIIRREVIISEEKPKKEEIKKETKRENVGFVERKQNSDYNIVYRNKPNKPKTVSELFGLKSNGNENEKAKQEPEIKKVVKKVEEQPKQEQKQPKAPSFNQQNHSKDNNFHHQNNRNNMGDNKFNHKNNGGNYQKNKFENGNQRRPLDEKGIEKNIKNIMTAYKRI